MPSSVYSSSNQRSYNYENNNDDDYQRSHTNSHQKPKREKGGCIAILARFDEHCMKPAFIHKYSKKKEQEADDFAHDFINDGGQIVESEYRRMSISS